MAGVPTVSPLVMSIRSAITRSLSSVAEQGCASQALVRAMLQELFSGFSKRARTMPRDYTGILEQSLEHYLDLLVLNEGGPTSIRDLVMWCPDAPAH